ncbi:hypothetical protein [Curtobacterium sp. Leaf261]|uniref:hypothetical protein n=1 Tax=Curtobacterium sp. Leaf261 TaxID=1736311 RepID=UPI0006FCF825|nr:hypothetical protein [Curtobacterium sp. Leaf261]KQO63766.1 hypothetical protein ASF23_06010 [Curtobacterium sp. Leaf261]
MQSLLLPAPMPPIRSAPSTLLLAEHDAHDRGQPFVDVGHLLVAAVSECAVHRRFRAVLDAHLVSVTALRASLPSNSYRASFATYDTDAGIVCTPAAMRVLARSMRHAATASVVAVQPQHVLLALLDGVDDPALGDAHLRLESVGADVRRLRRALRRATRRA